MTTQLETLIEKRREFYRIAQAEQDARNAEKKAAERKAACETLLAATEPIAALLNLPIEQQDISDDLVLTGCTTVNGEKLCTYIYLNNQQLVIKCEMPHTSNTMRWRLDDCLSDNLPYDPEGMRLDIASALVRLIDENESKAQAERQRLAAEERRRDLYANVRFYAELYLEYTELYGDPWLIFLSSHKPDLAAYYHNRSAWPIPDHLVANPSPDNLDTTLYPDPETL